MTRPREPSDVLLAPQFLRRLESLAIRAQQHASGRERGVHTSQRAGSGVAFASHRSYARGDDLRQLDWKLFARSDRLFVKQLEEERDLSLHILLDRSGSMGGAKFRLARQLAAALGYIALINLDRVSIEPYGGDALTRLAPLRGRDRALSMLRFLAALQPQGESDLPEAARRVCARAGRAGIAVVISDGFEEPGFLRGIDAFRYGRLEPTVLLISDPEEADPPLRGAVTLVDVESGHELGVRASEALLARYRRAYRERTDALVQALHARGVRVALLSSELSLERALPILQQCGVVD